MCPLDDMHTSGLGRLNQQAHSLVQRLATGCQNGNLGSATVAVYDTAWLSMVSKNVDGQQTWLFPECFQFLLENQLPNGGWQSYSTSDDGLLNTLAALLAIQKHINGSDVSHRPDLSDLEARASKARTYLHQSLQHWDVNESLNVGFEILIPALLSMLESENIRFDFPGRQRLEKLEARKLARFDPEVLYRIPTTFLHSLEAFIDRIDFDKLSHHKICGSMMASPASTAACLMRSSVWDSEAEGYLRKVVREGSGASTGGVPSVFPMPVFESSWILSTLLQGGFSIEDLGKDNVEIVAVYLEDYLERQDNLLGFAPAVPADADDTAKALLTLGLLGRAVKPDQMIDHFKSEDGHFRTYPEETEASFSANCNVLIALVQMPNVEDYSTCIHGIIGFLSEYWWSRSPRDKWNTSLQYSMMLLAEALTRFLLVWDKGLLKTVSEVLIRDRILVILYQILNRTLLGQTTDGAWHFEGYPEGYPEVTAYGVLTLKALQSLPFHTSLGDAVASGIRCGQHRLDQMQDEWTTPVYVWVEKVTYGSARLSESYCLAAMNVSGTSYTWSDRVMSLVDVSEKQLSRLLQLFAALQDFQDEPRWKLIASALEGYAFLPQLKLAGSRILSEQKGAKNEYLAYIPFTWVLINNHLRLFLSANLLWDMMLLTVCNFRVDEYMESAVGKLSETDLEPVKAMIHHFCSAQQLIPKVVFDIEHPCMTGEVGVNGRESEGSDAHSKATNESTAAAHVDYAVSTPSSVRAVLGHYTRAILNYPRVLAASTSDQANFRKALCTFLLSHIAQIADNSSLATQCLWDSPMTPVIANPRQSFYHWVHTTGAESVSCPFSFAFLTCLLGAASASTNQNFDEPAHDCFGSARRKYLAQELCMHLAVMSRLYNDFGSLKRDRLEANVNSVNFPEFHNGATHATDPSEDLVAEQEIRLKADLLELAKNERHSADIAAERFIDDMESSSEKGIGMRKKKEKVDAVRLFTGVTRLYADIYVARDLSNRTAA